MEKEQLENAGEAATTPRRKKSEKRKFENDPKTFFHGLGKKFRIGGNLGDRGKFRWIRYQISPLNENKVAEIVKQHAREKNISGGEARILVISEDNNSFKSEHRMVVPLPTLNEKRESYVTSDVLFLTEKLQGQQKEITEMIQETKAEIENLKTSGGKQTGFAELLTPWLPIVVPIIQSTIQNFSSLFSQMLQRPAAGPGLDLQSQMPLIELGKELGRLQGLAEMAEEAPADDSGIQLISAVVNALAGSRGGQTKNFDDIISGLSSIMNSQKPPAQDPPNQDMETENGDISEGGGS